jgi:hypothetical protein
MALYRNAICNNISIFVGYFIMLSASQVLYGRILGCLVHNESAKIWKELIVMYWRHILILLGKYPWKPYIRIFGTSGEIRIQHSQNTSLEPYHYTNLLSNSLLILICAPLNT